MSGTPRGVPADDAPAIGLESIWRHAAVGMAVVDARLRFVRINERLAEMNGASVEAHIGRTVRELVPDLTEQGHTPLQIDSREPSIPMQQYALNETRYRMLMQSDQARSEELLKEAQQDVELRWKMYAQFAALYAESKGK